MSASSKHPWSLWELMQQIDVSKLFRAISGLGNASGPFGSDAQQMGPTSFPRMNFDQLVEMLDDAVNQLERLDCSVTLRSVVEARELATKNVRLEASEAFGGQEIATWDWPINGRMAELFHQIRARASDELASKYVLSLSEGQRRYYDPPAPLFGEEVNNAFPSSASEIAEAGKCRATGRWTACVMHLMRALEPAILAFQDSMQVKVPKISWQDIINQIEAANKARGNKHPDYRWNSEASAQFLRFKDAWRNYAMHGKERYDEERAVEIYDSVRAFMRHLASRLKEQP